MTVIHKIDIGPSCAVSNQLDCEIQGLQVLSHTFVEIDREIMSTVIHLPLIQERLLSVTRP